MALAAKTTSGILWNLAEQLARRGIGVAVTLLLARFLAPEDFGLVAMMTVFLALGQSLMDSGFREALIRIEQISQEDYTTAFFANLVLGLVSYAALFASAPAIAAFYEEPGLVALIRVTSLVIIITSFQVVQVASLSRTLNFKAQLKAGFPAALISGAVAVTLAYLGWGVWSLVAQTLLNALLHTVLLWCMQGWRPTSQFSWTSLKGMYRFGYKLFLSGGLDILFQNLYVVVIAKIFSAHIAGLYFLANKLREFLVQQLVTAIQKVTYPALATLQSDDLRLKRGYQKIVILMTTILFPVVIFTTALAEPIFNILLPEKWMPAVPYFQLLCLASIMIPLHSINLNILKVKGRSDLFLYLEVLKKIVNGVVLFATYSHGIYAIIFGQIATSFLNYIPNSYFSSQLIGYGLREQLVDFVPVLLISLMAAGTGYVFMKTVSLHPMLLIVVAALIMMGAFVLLNLILNQERFNITIGYLRNILPRNSKNT